MLGSGLDSLKLADTIRTIDGEGSDPPVLYCQSMDDEFAWVQLATIQSRESDSVSKRWVITFGQSYLERDTDLRILISQKLNSSGYQLDCSSVSTTLRLNEDISSDDLADFIVAMIISRSKNVDASRVELVLEYR